MLWTIPVSESNPMCAFIPKCHWYPFLIWCISGFRSPARFLVDHRLDDGGVHDGSLQQLQSLGLQVGVDFRNQALAQVMPFQEMAEVEDGGLAGQRA